ncbi:MAG: RHS repeat domain-containing protein, partial [Candidatus Methanomethylicia archaeon]
MLIKAFSFLLICSLGIFFDLQAEEKPYLVYEFSDSGKILMISCDSEKIKFEYDKLGQLKKIIYTDGNYDEYFYDEKGNLFKIKSSDGEIIEYRYDRKNKIREIIYPDGNSYVFTF